MKVADAFWPKGTPHLWPEFLWLVLGLIAVIDCSGIGYSAELNSVLPSTEIVDFDSDIMPIITHSGCNAGACHGAAAGRGDFRLSLFGANPQNDFDQIVRFRRGRRVDHIDPKQSLILLKPTETIDHEGGTRFESESDEWQTIVRWIEQGAKRSNTRTIDSVRIEPSSDLVAEVGQSNSLIVVASFSDQTRRDVTSMTSFEPLDPQALTIQKGTITAHRPGRHHVVVRYLSFVQLVSITVPLGPPLNLASQPRLHWIDEEIYRQLGQMGIRPTGLASDEAMIRRLTLDLAGRLPLIEEVRAFLASTAPNKYEQLVDRLLDSENYTSLWTQYVSDWMHVGGGKMKPDAASSYYTWIRNAIGNNRSLAELASESILSNGPVSQGATGFYRLTDDARQQAELASEIWMGVRLRCANCHDHPLDRWTQDDYHGLAAVFARVDHGANVALKPSGTVQHPRTGQAASPRVPGGKAISDIDPREPLAKWLTDSRNPYFATCLVNRVWNHMMGRGFYQPLDDQRVTNPVSHPDLLRKLSDEFIANDFRLKHLVRNIVMSSAYRRNTGETDAQRIAFHAASITRPLSSPALLDAIDDVLEFVRPRSAQLSIPHVDVSVVRHVEKIVPYSDAELKLLGVCDRSVACEPSTASTGGGVAGVLQLLNGPILNERIADSANWLNRSIDTGSSDRELLNDLYLRAYSRLPMVTEHAHWEKILSTAVTPDDRRLMWQDLCWSVLSSQEFRTNH